MSDLIRSSIGAAVPKVKLLQDFRSELLGVLGHRCRGRRFLRGFAEDLIQEVLLRAVQQFGPQPSLHAKELWTWLLTVLDRCAIDHFRRQRSPFRNTVPLTESIVAARTRPLLDQLIDVE
ncbi:MAG TPA: sigma factor, partial [Gemmataceae bacterium]|nr:sigma factor [Gemmataceae bacterium]